MQEPSFWSTFRDLDSSDDATDAVDWLERFASLVPVQVAKQRSYELLRAGPGGHILDAGCGHGGDAWALSGLVAPDGRVVGIDSSAAAVAAAREAAAARGVARVEFQTADVVDLPFADGAFDGCRCDRTLQHVADPHAALKELVRVARPGGLVLVSESWNQPVAAADIDLMGLRQLLSMFQTGGEREGAWFGLLLPPLFRHAGLVDVRKEVVSGELSDSASIETFYDLPRLAARAVADGRLTRQEGDAVVELVRRESQQGRLTVVVETHLLVGRVPPADRA